MSGKLLYGEDRTGRCGFFVDRDKLTTGRLALGEGVQSPFAFYRVPPVCLRQTGGEAVEKVVPRKISHGGKV